MKQRLKNKRIITVTGPIPASQLGFTLPHEHIMVDFIGAEQTGKHRYRREDVIKRILPFLKEIYDLNVRAFVDCTPQYLGRDVEILKALSVASGLAIVTNTGLYKDQYLPNYVDDQAPEQIAEQWIKEAEEGIEHTSIKPGFIKTAVNPGSLTEREKKLLTAAALTSKATGLTIATHTGSRVAAMDIIKILEKQDIPFDKWIFVHAHQEENLESLAELASLGVWIELDGLAFANDDNHLARVKYLLAKGLEHKILLSHDGGWYNVGEENGGQVRSYTHLNLMFLPRLRREGVPDPILHLLTVDNPAQAFAV
jgi:phosphotriesterase-related protein